MLQSMGISPDIPNVTTPMSPSAKSVGSESGSQDSGDGKLGMAKVTQVDFPPKEMVSYSKETQTPADTQTHTQAKPEEEEEEEEMADPKPAEDSQEEKADEEEKQEEVLPKELTEEEKMHLLNSEEFMAFFDRGSRIVERALSERVDVCFDYSGRDLEDREGEMQAGAKMSLSRVFSDERWSKNRVVTCLDWSPQYPELLVASYNSNDDAPHEPDGVALVWNMKYKKTTPEYTFHCQHPVYCVNVVGTENAHNLISISTDGKMCSWNLDMLSQPQDSLELVFKQSKAVAVTSMAFPLGDVNNFVVGSEDGSLYTACRHGSKAGISDVFDGHHGPVTGLSCHSAGGPVDFSHLFISASFDWTVKLWTTKSTRPLYLFEDSCDYVYDVMWSPTHPALFACVDGSGRLDLWNLNNDTEVPSASVVVDGSPALNRVRWAHSGREIATGDSDGQVLVYDVGEKICVPKADEWTRFVHTLVEINENRDEGDELAAQRLLA
uniref:Dynein cytoplasmic 1 intermediate chain 2 n=1 Tax=Hucho hucho TaxID=62062 RepID=A0A4W5Q083_9TELE